MPDTRSVGHWKSCASLQIVKRDRKSYIINISKEYSIVSQFTSFVAIEEREKVRSEDPVPNPSASVVPPPFPFCRVRSLTCRKGPPWKSLSPRRQWISWCTWAGWWTKGETQPR